MSKRKLKELLTTSTDAINYQEAFTTALNIDTEEDTISIRQNLKNKSLKELKNIQNHIQSIKITNRVFQIRHKPLINILYKPLVNINLIIDKLQFMKQHLEEITDTILMEEYPSFKNGANRLNVEKLSAEIESFIEKKEEEHKKRKENNMEE